MKHHIMIVEDDPSLRDLFTIVVQQAGYEVTTAENGFEALYLLETEQPELLVLDMNLPVFSGMQIIRHVRNTENLKHIKIIAASANTTANKSDEAQMADAIFPKPFRNHELVDLIAKLLDTTSK